MLDIFNIPGQQDNVKIFYASDTNAWQTWTRPRNCKFVWIMCIGGGMGGQGGAGTTPTQAGSGGPSGALTRALFPANVLPDILYVQTGAGSNGGGGAAGQTTNNAPGNPGRSFVSLTPSSAVVMNLVCTSGLAAGVGSTLTPETAATVAAAGLLSLGNFISVAGTATTSLSTTIVTGGANGLTSTSAAGNNVTGISTPGLEIPTSAGGTGGTGGDGGNGFQSFKPLCSIGGASGGGNTGGNGGRGGNGGIGSGGGAGGPGSATGGTGGKGGDGLVIIATF